MKPSLRIGDEGLWIIGRDFVAEAEQLMKQMLKELARFAHGQRKPDSRCWSPAIVDNRSQSTTQSPTLATDLRYVAPSPLVFYKDQEKLVASC